MSAHVTKEAPGRRPRPFWLRRPAMIASGLRLDRDRPDLDHLNKINDPEEFVWAVLPYAARSFAPSIFLLPEKTARTFAVAYLYARMLDTYEDLSPGPVEAQDSLEAFAARFRSDPLAFAPDPPSPTAVASCDRAHLLLVKRYALVDEVFRGLPEGDRERIAALIRLMATGMATYSEVFHRQNGVLEHAEQVSDYCHRALGLPALFVLDTFFGEVSADHRRHALRVSEFIQLANITRDIEKDLQVGVAYHPRLRPYLGSDGLGAARSAVRQTRKDLVIIAAARVDSFRLLLDGHALPSFSLARSAAVLLMLFTERHYRRMAAAVGLNSWRGPRSVFAMLVACLPAIWSARWADRVVRRAERGLRAIS